MNEKKRNSALDIVRIISAIFVMIYHTEGAKWYLGLDNIFSTIKFKRLWPITFGPFMVMSMFILVAHLSSTKTISIKELLAKRFFRIYPVYFFISFLGIFVFPNYISFLDFPTANIDLLSITILAMSFNPEVIQIIFGEVLFINILWFLGAQEKLYFYFMMMMKFLKKYFFTGVVVNLCVVVIVRFIVQESEQPFVLLKKILNVYPVEYGLVGGIFGILYHRFKEKVWLKNPLILVSVLVLLVFSLSFSHESHFLSHTYFAFLIGIGIIHLLTSSLYIKTIEKVARLTYGFYVSHVVFVIIFLNAFKSTAEPTLNTFLYSSIIVSSFFSAYIIHRFVEKPILKLLKN